MKIITDTNVLVRALVQDNEAQTRAAIESLKSAGAIVIPKTSFLRTRLSPAAIQVRSKSNRKSGRFAYADAKRHYRSAEVEAGRKSQEAGGDFADGAIASEGAWLGGEMFVSFDKKATALLAEQGRKVQLLAG